MIAEALRIVSTLGNIKFDGLFPIKDNNTIIKYNTMKTHTIKLKKGYTAKDVTVTIENGEIEVSYNEDQMKSKRWRAKEGEIYYVATATGCVAHNTEEFSDIDTDWYESGNYFQTKKQAVKMAEKLRKILEEE